MLILFIAIAFPARAQSFEEGNVFTLHVIKVRLKGGVSMDEFTAFMKDEFLPAWEEHYEGIETVLLYARRGAHDSDFGWINYYDSEEELKSFYPEPGKRSPRAEAAAEKMKPYEQLMEKYGNMRYAGYTTWEVQ